MFRSYLLLLVLHHFSFVAVWNSYLIENWVETLVWNNKSNNTEKYYNINIQILITHDIFLAKMVLCQTCQTENVLGLKSKENGTQMALFPDSKSDVFP